MLSIQPRSTLALGVSLALFAAAHAPPVVAQQAPPSPPTPGAATGELENIVVTGSHIRGAIESGAIAVTVISSAELETFAQRSTGELFEFIAQSGTFEINSAADGPNDARGDIATVNLRGLGTGNTLVLLNGRRIAAHAVNQDIGSTPRQVTNVNAFPSTGIDRVEVLRDGASALYGADATAGVVDTILKADVEKTRISVLGSGLEGTDEQELLFDVATGFQFNEGRTRTLFVGSYFTRDGLYTTDLGGQFESVDKRAFLGDSPFATETVDFRNTSTSSPFGQYQAGVFADDTFTTRRVRQGTQALTSTTGVFHIQPCDFPGTRVQIGDRAEGCMGIDDAALDTGLRYDFNANQPNNSLDEGVDIQQDPVSAKGRQLISDLDRINTYALVEHDISDSLQFFGEALYYEASTESNRAAQPTDSGLAFLVVPRQNYWNPLGPVGSPNRLPDLNSADVPDEGLDVLVRNWRPTELGPRFITTDTTTYRLLAGLRGDLGAWEWESALGYSENETTDQESNRISKTLLQEQLSLDTPEAINPFGGPNSNTTEQWDRARISSTNVGETELTTLDFRASNSDLFNGWAGPIGAAFGVEYRREAYLEDRDPRLDGTIIFSTQNVSGMSDVVGVSPTEDSNASRNVYSAYAETLVPLHRGEGTWINDLTLQLALRGEYFDDIEDGTVKPKVALSWFPVAAVNLRATYAEGFRVPNLVQLNRGDVSRLNLGNEDYWRQSNSTTPIVPGDAVATGDAYMPSLRQSNPDLDNEDTETIVAGVVVDLTRAWKPQWLDELRFSVDYWRFEQTGVIGAFGDQEALALDYLLRREGASNPNVVRADVNADDLLAFAEWNAANPDDQREAAGQVLYIVDPYINLDSQTADGFDFGLAAGFDAGRAGRFDIRLEATHLMTLDVVRNDLLLAIAADPALDGEFPELEVDRVALDGNPEWRVTTSLLWRLGNFGGGASWRYVDGFTDTGASVDVNDDGVEEFWQVDSDSRINVFADYRFKLDVVDSLRVRFGVNNLFDDTPPLADESLGYRPDYHSVKNREFYLQLSTSF